MKELTGKILVGSKYFFTVFDDFAPKDNDFVIVVEPNEEFRFCREIHITNQKCIFQIVQRPVDEIIDWINSGSSPMQIGKFLVPEFCEFIGFDFDRDIKKLKLSIDKLDKKHLYEKIIYDAYVENGAMYLTDKQREAAYLSYKETRKEESKDNN